jgi:hypothetical protein
MNKSILITINIGLNCLELLACIAGFINWKKIRHTYWKWFPVYLAVIVLTEVTAECIMYIGKNQALNADIYRFFGIPIQFLFFFWLIAQYLKPYKENKWPLYAAAIYILSWFADFFYFSERNILFQSFSYTMANALLLVLIILFFIKFMNSNEILNYRSSMMFWVCLGLLIFYLGTFPFYGLRNTLYKSFRSIFDVYWYISFILDYLMYVLFAIAFVWGRK